MVPCTTVSVFILGILPLEILLFSLLLFLVVYIFVCLKLFFDCFNQFSTFTRALFCFVVGYFTTSHTYQL